MLDRFEIEPTEDTPEVILDAEQQIFQLSGRSMPEDAYEFYSPIFSWLNEYVKEPAKETHFICNLEYFNSSSAKKIVELFFILERIIDEDVRVFWYFEREDRLIETKGLELKKLLKIPVEMVVMEEN